LTIRPRENLVGGLGPDEGVSAVAVLRRPGEPEPPSRRQSLFPPQPDVPGPLGDLPGPADIAEAVAFLASDRAAYITGEVLNVAAGAYMRN